MSFFFAGVLSLKQLLRLIWFKCSCNSKFRIGGFCSYARVVRVLPPIFSKGISCKISCKKTHYSCIFLARIAQALHSNCKIFAGFVSYLQEVAKFCILMQFYFLNIFDVLVFSVRFFKKSSPKFRFRVVYSKPQLQNKYLLKLGPSPIVS